MLMQLLRSSSKLAQLAKLSNLLQRFAKSPASASLQGFFMHSAIECGADLEQNGQPATLAISQYVII
jgi:hypothetical protein